MSENMSDILCSTEEEIGHGSRIERNVANDGHKITSTVSKVTKKQGRKKKGKDKCTFENCSSTAVKFIGDCNFCDGHFCSKHRLLENHDCKGLDCCKDQMRQRNADKLRKEQPSIPKIQI